MKRVELIFNLLAIPIDAAAVLASAVFAYVLRIKFANVWPIIFQINTVEYLRTVAIILPFLLVLFALYGLYNLRSTDRLSGELTRIIAAVTTALLVIVLIFFFDRNIFPSRLIVLFSWAIVIVLVGVGRIVLRFIRDGQLRRGKGVHKLAVITGPKTDTKVIEEMKDQPEMGYQISGSFNSSDPGLLQELEKLHKDHLLDELLQADPDYPSGKNAELVRFCHDRGVKFNFVPDIFDLAAQHIEVEMIGGAPIIKLKGTPLDGWGRVVKRGMDLFLSVLVLVIASPIFLAIYIAIKLDSRGPAIYIAPRHGRSQEFPFYKFRTMYTHLSTGDGYGGEQAEKMLSDLVAQSMRNGPIYKIQNDPRVTRVGRFLRRTKLDELPQFWNVLRDEMSLVGPRAHVLDQVAQYRDSHKRLFTIKPGITGLTQLAQMAQPDLPFEEEARLDTYYIENWSVILDIKILFKTLWVLVACKYTRTDN